MSELEGDTICNKPLTEMERVGSEQAEWRRDAPCIFAKSRFEGFKACIKKYSFGINLFSST
jgi:hypothetical protein